MEKGSTRAIISKDQKSAERNRIRAQDECKVPYIFELGNRGILETVLLQEKE